MSYTPASNITIGCTTKFAEHIMNRVRHENELGGVSYARSVQILSEEMEQRDKSREVIFDQTVNGKRILVDGDTAPLVNKDYCETCVSMTEANESMEQELIALRSRNKILTTVNRGLFDRVKEMQAKFDEFVDSLYAADQEAVDLENLDSVKPV